MTHREKFIKALRHEPITGHVPHFELVFFLTMEKFRKVHPTHRRFDQWGQMSAHEKELQLADQAELYIQTAQTYDHSAIFVHQNPGDLESTVRLLELIREKSGDEYFVMLHADPTFAMPNGDNMMEFTARMYEDAEGLHEEAKRSLDGLVSFFTALTGHKGLVDAGALCSDYCFNVNPFFTRDQFAEFVAPYLKQVIAEYHRLGLFAIKHTDGNIMPILDQMLDCEPDAFHSLDPQGGVSLAEMKRICGGRTALIGNVNCGLLQTGTEEEVAADVRRALHDGMPGYGYIFSTSNFVYTGLPLERYELMWKIWREEGVYPPMA